MWATTQSIHNVRILLGQIFDIPLSKIDVRRIPVGGTFGSSIQMNSNIPICAALALKARRPVRLSLTREEDMQEHTKYPSQISLKLAAKKDGTLLGAEMELIVDIGAHIVQAYSYLGVCIGWLVSLYRLPHIKYHGVAVYTNKVPSCAMQGFGNPQVTFAVESLMDELAAKLGLDPIDLRLKNYVGDGDTFWGQGPLVRSIVRSDGVPELLHRGSEIMGWEWDADSTDGTVSYAPFLTTRYRRGVGMARGFHTSSAGAPQPGDVIDYSGAMVKINQDGSIDVITALMDHGGGTLEAIAKLVSEALCVPLDKVNLSPAGTRTTVYDVVTHATRGVYAGGGAAVKAVQEAKADLFATAARFLNVQPEALSLKLDEKLGPGRALRPVDPRQADHDRRGGHPVLDGKLENDRQRRELPADLLPARIRVGVPRRRGRHVDGSGADGAGSDGQRLRHGDQPGHGRGAARRRAIQGRGIRAPGRQRLGRPRPTAVKGLHGRRQDTGIRRDAVHQCDHDVLRPYV